MKKSLLAVFLIAFIPALLLTDAVGDTYLQVRKNMVTGQIRSRGIIDKKVLDAMTRIHRHRFVPEELASQAYADHPLPIGGGQTISQPYIVALMTESLGITKNHHVLEIGTGSGYQAAVLAEIAKDVYSIEIKEKLHKKATEVLRSMGLANVKTRHGDGYFGWKEAAPFDGIMITAAVNHIPPPLLNNSETAGNWSSRWEIHSAIRISPLSQNAGMTIRSNK